MNMKKSLGCGLLVITCLVYLSAARSPPGLLSRDQEDRSISESEGTTSERAHPHPHSRPTPTSDKPGPVRRLSVLRMSRRSDDTLTDDEDLNSSGDDSVESRTSETSICGPGREDEDEYYACEEPKTTQGDDNGPVITSDYFDEGTTVSGEDKDQQKCSADQFSCATGSTCVPLSARCNLLHDCPDGSDEDSCSYPTTGTALLCLVLLTAAVLLSCWAVLHHSRARQNGGVPPDLPSTTVHPRSSLVSLHEEERSQSGGQTGNGDFALECCESAEKC